MKKRTRRQIPWHLPASLTRNDVGLCLLFLGAAFVICMLGWLAIDTIRSADQIGIGTGQNPQFGQYHPVVVEESRNANIVLNRVLFLELLH